MCGKCVVFWYNVAERQDFVEQSKLRSRAPSARVAARPKTDSGGVRLAVQPGSVVVGRIEAITAREKRVRGELATKVAALSQLRATRQGQGAAAIG